MKNKLRAFFGCAADKIVIFVTKKELFLVGCIAIVAGFLFIAPPLALKHYFEASGKHFVLAQLKTYRDELYTYLPRAREIYDGHFPPAELSLDQQGPSPLNALPSLVFSSFIFLSGGNINAAYLLAQFVFSAIIFILLYILGRLLLRSRPWAFLMATLGTLTPILPGVFSFDFKNDPNVLFNFTIKQFVPIVNTQIDKLSLSRIDSPLLVLPFYLLSIIFFILFFRQPKFILTIFAGISAGILAYVYITTWIYWMIMLGIVFVLIFIFKRDDKLLIKNFILLFFVCALTLIPYAINYLRFKSIPFSEDISYRLSIFSGRELGIFSGNLLDYFVYILMAGAVFFVYFRKRGKISSESDDKKEGLLFFGLIIAAAVVWNIQLVLGQSVFLPKWRYPISVALYLILFSLVCRWLEYFKSNRRSLIRIGSITVVVLTLFVFIKYTYNSVSILIKPNHETLAYYEFSDDIIDSWDWINANIDGEPKILSPSYVTSIYLMTYTSARPFLPRGHLTLASNYELENRFLSARKLFNVPPDLLRQELEGKVKFDCSDSGCFPDIGINLNKTTFQLYGDGFKKTFRQSLTSVGGTAGMPAGKIDELMSRYQDVNTNLAVEESDYVYFGPWEKQLGALNPLSKHELDLKFRNDSVEIYKIVKRRRI